MIKKAETLEPWFIINKMGIIVFGGSGYIGRNLCKHYSKNGDLLAGTYYGAPVKNLTYFDVRNQNLDSLGIDLKKAKYGFICTAISKIEDCKRNPIKAYEINILGNKRLIENLWTNNILPIFFSTDAVFDGKKGNYTESDELNPVHVYGKHKKIIEDFLIESKNPFLIVRLSKVFGTTRGDNTLLTSWVEQLLENKEINCIKDQTFNPIFIGDLINSFDILLKKKLNGIYNLGCPESFNRYDLAKMVKKQLKIKTGKINPISVKDLNFLDARPLNTTMNCKKFIKDTGYEFRPMKECIRDLRILKVYKVKYV